MTASSTGSATGGVQWPPMHARMTYPSSAACPQVQRDHRPAEEFHRAQLTPSVRLRQAEHALGDEAQDELRRDRRDAPDERFAQVALDVILARIAEAAV